jgi:glycine betaine/proline transport system ATP-binding protein
MTAAIEVRNLWKLYGHREKELLPLIRRDSLTKVQALARYGCGIGVADASFTVAEGEVFCVMGLSGSGKSTLVRLINRIIEPTSGTVLIGGEDITRKDDKALRVMRTEKIGMVFQNFALLPHRTVAENVALPLEIKRVKKRQRRESAERVLSMVGLSNWANSFPHELSGGMQQRVGLARAMAGDPEILLMDEPFSALDPLIRRQLQKEFLDLSRLARKTTVFITHDLEEAIRIGHRIAIMKDGMLVQIGKPEDIVLKPADAYIAEFVSGISRLNVIYAHNVMEPIESYRTHAGVDLSNAPRAQSRDNLNRLIDLAATTDGPIAVVDGDRNLIGVVDHPHLLRGLQGRQP